MTATGLNIYETYYAGSVKRIWAKDNTGHWLKVWENATVESLGYSRIFASTFNVRMLFVIAS